MLVVIDDFADTPQLHKPHGALDTLFIRGRHTQISTWVSSQDVRLAWRYQGYGGTRFVEDDLAGDSKAGALASNGQGPPSITERLRSTADGAQAAADLKSGSCRRTLSVNVLPRPGQPQPPPQIIGRSSDVERLLDKRGAQAVEGRGCGRLPLLSRAWAELRVPGGPG